MSSFNLLIEGLLFLLFAILQALFINGIKGASEGSVEERPDGSKHFTGMVLYPIAHWLTTTKKVKVYYNEKTLYPLITQLLAKYEGKGLAFPKTLSQLNIIKTTDTCHWIKLHFGVKEYELVEQFAKFLLEREGIDYRFHGPLDAVIFFRWYDVPVLPAIVRKPLIECIKCMASFWGALTFWPVAIALIGFHWFLIPLFIADVFILVYLNYFYYKKLLR